MTNRTRAGIQVSLLLTAAACLGGAAYAQTDLSGEWRVVRSEDNFHNPYNGDTGGLPLNEAGYRRSDTWDASIQSLPEWQCRPHSGAYITRGPSALKIWKEVDPVSRETVAFHTEWLRSIDNPIWMDGRSHPSEHAPHTWAGFSTGEWVGDVLKVTTTHVKEDYIRRNGPPQSDRITMTEYLILRSVGNEDYLSWTKVVYDPDYLTEPLIRTTEYIRRPHDQVPPYPCTVVTEVDRPRGYVPSWFPGENPHLGEYEEHLGIPAEAARQGAISMYPEFRAMIRENGWEARRLDEATPTFEAQQNAPVSGAR